MSSGLDQISHDSFVECRNALTSGNALTWRSSTSDLAVSVWVSDNAVPVKFSSRLKCLFTNSTCIRTRFVFTHVSEPTSSVKCPKWTVVLIVKLCEGARKRANSFLDFLNF